MPTPATNERLPNYGTTTTIRGVVEALTMGLVNTDVAYIQPWWLSELCAQ